MLTGDARHDRLSLVRLTDGSDADNGERKKELTPDGGHGKIGR